MNTFLSNKQGVGRDRYADTRNGTMKIRRTIGRRLQRPVGVLAPPSAEEIAWREAMSRTRTRVPKGVFRYASIEEAKADWERWHVELVASTVRR
jgi:hypothetical protein